MKTPLRLFIILAMLPVISAAETADSQEVTFDVVTTFDYPGATLTFAYGINDRAQVAGYFVDRTDIHGYVRLGDHFSAPINDPNDPNDRHHTTSLSGINNLGAV